MAEYLYRLGRFAIRRRPDLDIEGAQLKERLGADAIAAGEHEVAPTPEIQPST